MYKIEDELGQVWYVGSGDPAHGIVQKLRSLHYTWIVLPRHVIIRGYSPTESWVATLRRARRLGYNTLGGRRRLRLAECLHLLAKLG